MSDLVCPECGHGSFTAILTTRTEYTYNVTESGDLIEVDETAYDGGDQSEIDRVTCDDCDGDFYPEQAPEGDDGYGYLITQEQYDHEPDFEAEQEARLASHEPVGDTW